MATAKESPITIREYRDSDRAAVEHICAVTGLRGNLEKHFCDRESFVKLWLSPYLNPGTTQAYNLVCVRDDRVVGYLVGWLGGGYNWRVLRVNFVTMLRVLFRWGTGQYRHHPPTGHFIRWMLFRMWREYPPRPDDMESHMHFNLLEEARHGRFGPKMQHMFMDQVLDRGYAGWHGCVFVGPSRPVEVYIRFGMDIGEKRRCSLFTDEEVYFTSLYMPMEERRKQREMEANS